MNEPHLMDGMVVMPHDEFETLLERAAERGARHALSDVGLDGPEAANDIRELSNLLDAFPAAKKTAGLTLVKMLVQGLLLALLAVIIVHIKLFGGPHLARTIPNTPPTSLPPVPNSSPTNS